LFEFSDHFDIWEHPVELKKLLIGDLANEMTVKVTNHKNQSMPKYQIGKYQKPDLKWDGFLNKQVEHRKMVWKSTGVQSGICTNTCMCVLVICLELLFDKVKTLLS
jgi:hypothetical protein